LCFERSFSRQNSVIRLKSNILPPPNFWAGYATGAKPFWGVRVTGSLWNELHCWTADWAAKSTAVEFDSILSGCPNQISLICVGRQQKLFFFFQLHTVVKLFFNDITIFKSKHRYQLQPEDDIRWALVTTGSYFDKLVKQSQGQNSHWNCECGRWTEFAKSSVCIILAALVYHESAKIYTRSKIVRVLKRLRNTALESGCSACFV